MIFSAATKTQALQVAQKDQMVTVELFLAQKVACASRKMIWSKIHALLQMEEFHRMACGAQDPHQGLALLECILFHQHLSLRTRVECVMCANRVCIQAKPIPKTVSNVPAAATKDKWSLVTIVTNNLGKMFLNVSPAGQEHTKPKMQ